MKCYGPIILLCLSKYIIYLSAVQWQVDDLYLYAVIITKQTSTDTNIIIFSEKCVLFLKRPNPDITLIHVLPYYFLIYT